MTHPTHAPPTPKWVSRRQAAFLGAIGTIAFALAFGLGTILNVATGTPLVGGLANGVIVAMVLTIGVRATNTLPAATILWLVFGVLAIPTTTLGPPGIYKVIPALVAGLLWDFVILLFRRRGLGYVIGGVFAAIALMVLIYFIGAAIGLPGSDKLRKALPFLLPVNGALALIGILLGLSLWKRRLQDWPLLRIFSA